MKTHKFYLFIVIAGFFAPHGVSHPGYWVPKPAPRAHYKITARIDTAAHTIMGNAAVRFINPSSKEISVVAFNWTIDDQSPLFVTANGDSLTLKSDRSQNPDFSPRVYALPSPIPPGDSIEFIINFHTAYRSRNLYEIKLIDWYPRLWWDGHDTFDSFQVKLDFPQNYAIAVSGRYNDETGFYENHGARRCGIYLRKGLLSAKKQIDDVTITALFTPDGTACAQLCLDTAADAVQFYKDRLGFYPFTFLYIVPGGVQPMGGYPFASGIVVIHGQERFREKPLSHWQWITAHEIGHQYWGEYVFDADHSWLWIGLGLYADLEYSQNRNLDTDQHTNMKKRYLWGVKKHYDTTADLTASQVRKTTFDHNNIIKHGKGFSIISALECVLGQDVFFQIYQYCLQNYGGFYLDVDAFWRICERKSGRDLGWFFQQWVRSNDYLSCGIVSQTCVPKDGRYISSVRVKNYGTLKMPVPVQAVFADSTSQTQWTNRLLETNDLVFDSASELIQAVIDPEDKLAMIEDTLFVSGDEIIDKVSRLPWTNAGKRASRLFTLAGKVNVSDHRSWYKLGLVLVEAGHYVKAFKAFERAQKIGPRDFITTVWLGNASDLLGEREKAVKYYQKALEYDDGGTYQSSQFRLFIDKKWVEERLSTPFTLGPENQVK